MQKHRRVLPGFALALGCTLFYLALVVLLPLAAVLLKTLSLSWTEFTAAVASPRVVAAYRVTIVAALCATVINSIFGFLLAWIVVRYDFRGRRLLDAAIDLPFALPTAVAGLTLTTLLSHNGWVGRLLVPLNITVVYTVAGIAIAMAFTSIPFVVRSIQPVLEDLDADYEEAGKSLGASDWQIFRRVIFPQVLPACLVGASLAFARSLGEFGAVIFIAGNIPFKSEIAPLLIVAQLEQFNYAGAAAIATIMLVVSFVILLAINLLQAASRRRFGDV